MSINLKNFIWTRDPKEAMQNPYEWDAQKKFVKEANLFLREIRKHLIEKHLFTKENQSLEKAIWMLSLSALDSGIEILEGLKKNKIHVVSHLLRHIKESLELAKFFSLNTKKSSEKMVKWFNGEFISYRHYREYIRDELKDLTKFNSLRNEYEELSKFNHNNYFTLLFNYGLGLNDSLHHHGRFDSGIAIPPNTISLYHSYAAHYILNMAFEISLLKLISISELLDFIGDQNLNKEVKRRFEIKNRK